MPGSRNVNGADREKERQRRDEIGNCRKKTYLLSGRAEKDRIGNQKIIKGADRDLGGNAFFPGIPQAVLDIFRQRSSDYISHGMLI